jgi:hypothetical protein
MEASDPEHAAALEEYRRQLAKRERMTVSSLLMRINSAAHLSDHLVGLQHSVSGMYNCCLKRYRMDPEVHMAALEGSLDISLHVRSKHMPSSWCIVRSCTRMTRCMLSTICLPLLSRDASACQVTLLVADAAWRHADAS